MFNKINIDWHWPGPRTIKTGIAVAVCLIFYGIMGRDGIMMAVTASILCMQASVEKSLDAGKGNIIASLMGGALGTAAVFFGIPGHSAMAFIICALVGVVFLIHFCHITRLSESIVLSCLVYMTIITGFMAPEGLDPVAFSLNRIVDSLIGIMVTVFVNASIFKPPAQKGLLAEVIYIIRPISGARTTSWAGGATSELYIYPEDSFYGERNFGFRISTATVEVEESTFTSLPGFKRYIMTLEGDLTLSHEGQHKVKLGPCEKDFFLGDWSTKSEGKCKDFNLIARKGYNGGLEIILPGTELNLSTECFNGFYALEGSTEVEILIGGKEPVKKILQKSDFLIFKHDEIKDAKEYSVKFANEKCVHISVGREMHKE
ncbi:MAG: HutD family protein [Defluviitaleaceae bacterium]|nr:HutD family protein [Defluviitaleaceae bacterium]